MGHEITTAEALEELARLANGNVYARACLREFLNTKPVIATLEVDRDATARTGETVRYDEISEGLRDCLIACRAVALHEKRNDFCGGEHGGHPKVYNNFEITPEMIEAGALALSSYDPLLESLDEGSVRIFHRMVESS